jgi:hypothetical protein
MALCQRFGMALSQHGYGSMPGLWHSCKPACLWLYAGTLAWLYASMSMALCQCFGMALSQHAYGSMPALWHGCKPACLWLYAGTLVWLYASDLA